MTGVILGTLPIFYLSSQTGLSHRVPWIRVRWVTPSFLSRASGYASPGWRRRGCMLCIYQLNTKCAHMGHRWQTVHIIYNLAILLNPLWLSSRNRSVWISHPVSIPSEPSPSIVPGFLSPAWSPVSASLLSLGAVSVSITGAWVSVCQFSSYYLSYPVSSSYIVTYYSSSLPYLMPSSDPSSVHLLSSYSPPSPFP